MLFVRKLWGGGVGASDSNSAEPKPDATEPRQASSVPASPAVGLRRFVGGGVGFGGFASANATPETARRQRDRLASATGDAGQPEDVHEDDEAAAAAAAAGPSGASFFFSPAASFLTSAFSKHPQPTTASTGDAPMDDLDDDGGGSGSTVPTSSEDSPVTPPEPDLSHLTDEERLQIARVLARARQTELEEDERLRRLEINVQSQEDRASRHTSTVELDSSSNKCPLCLENDVNPVKSDYKCTECNRLVCYDCGNFCNDSGNKFAEWMCSICQKKRHLAMSSGAWYHGLRHQPISLQTLLKMNSSRKVERTQSFSFYDEMSGGASKSPSAGSPILRRRRSFPSRPRPAAGVYTPEDLGMTSAESSAAAAVNSASEATAAAAAAASAGPTPLSPQPPQRLALRRLPRSDEGQATQSMQQQQHLPRAAVSASTAPSAVSVAAQGSEDLISPRQHNQQQDQHTQRAAATATSSPTAARATASVLDDSSHSRQHNQLHDQNPPRTAISATGSPTSSRAIAPVSDSRHTRQQQQHERPQQQQDQNPSRAVVSVGSSPVAIRRAPQISDDPRHQRQYPQQQDQHPSRAVVSVGSSPVAVRRAPQIPDDPRHQRQHPQQQDQHPSRAVVSTGSSTVAHKSTASVSDDSLHIGQQQQQHHHQPRAVVSETNSPTVVRVTLPMTDDARHQRQQQQQQRRNVASESDASPQHTVPNYHSHHHQYQHQHLSLRRPGAPQSIDASNGSVPPTAVGAFESPPVSPRQRRNSFPEFYGLSPPLSPLNMGEALYAQPYTEMASPDDDDELEESCGRHHEDVNSKGAATTADIMPSDEATVVPQSSTSASASVIPAVKMVETDYLNRPLQTSIAHDSDAMDLASYAATIASSTDSLTLETVQQSSSAESKFRKMEEVAVVRLVAKDARQQHHQLLPAAAMAEKRRMTARVIETAPSTPAKAAAAPQVQQHPLSTARRKSLPPPPVPPPPPTQPPTLQHDQRLREPSPPSLASAAASSAAAVAISAAVATAPSASPPLPPPPAQFQTPPTQPTPLPQTYLQSTAPIDRERSGSSGSYKMVQEPSVEVTISRSTASEPYQASTLQQPIQTFSSRRPDATAIIATGIAAEATIVEGPKLRLAMSAPSPPMMPQLVSRSATGHTSVKIRDTVSVLPPLQSPQLPQLYQQQSNQLQQPTMQQQPSLQLQQHPQQSFSAEAVAMPVEEAIIKATSAQAKAAVHIEEEGEEAEMEYDRNLASPEMTGGRPISSPTPPPLAADRLREAPLRLPEVKVQAARQSNLMPTQQQQLPKQRSFEERGGQASGGFLSTVSGLFSSSRQQQQAPPPPLSPQPQQPPPPQPVQAGLTGFLSNQGTKIVSRISTAVVWQGSAEEKHMTVSEPKCESTSSQHHHQQQQQQKQQRPQQQQHQQQEHQIQRRQLQELDRQLEAIKRREAAAAAVAAPPLPVPVSSVLPRLAAATAATAPSSSPAATRYIANRFHRQQQQQQLQQQLQQQQRLARHGALSADVPRDLRAQKALLNQELLMVTHERRKQLNELQDIRWLEQQLEGVRHMEQAQMSAISEKLAGMPVYSTSQIGSVSAAAAAATSAYESLPRGRSRQQQHLLMQQQQQQQLRAAGGTYTRPIMQPRSHSSGRLGITDRMASSPMDSAWGSHHPSHPYHPAQHPNYQVSASSAGYYSASAADAINTGYHMLPPESDPYDLQQQQQQQQQSSRNISLSSDQLRRLDPHEQFYNHLQDESQSESGLLNLRNFDYELIKKENRIAQLEREIERRRRQIDEAIRYQEEMQRYSSLQHQQHQQHQLHLQHQSRAVAMAATVSTYSPFDSQHQQLLHHQQHHHTLSGATGYPYDDTAADFAVTRQQQQQQQQQQMPDEFFLPFAYDEQPPPPTRGHQQHHHPLHHQHLQPHQLIGDPGSTGIYDPALGATIQPMPLLDFHRQQQQLPTLSSAAIKDEYPYSKKTTMYEYDDCPQQPLQQQHSQQQQMQSGVDDLLRDRRQRRYDFPVKRLLLTRDSRDKSTRDPSIFETLRF